MYKKISNIKLYRKIIGRVKIISFIRENNLTRYNVSESNDEFLYLKKCF